MDQNESIRKCRKCGETSSIENFYFFNRRHNKPRKRGYVCKQCIYKRRKELRNKTVRAQCLQELQEWKNKHTGKIEGFIWSNLYRWHSRGPIQSDLTFDYLVALFYKQQKRCFYTGTLLDALKTPESNSKYRARSLAITQKNIASPSLDRLYPERGYIKGNVVWCSYVINSMKGDLNVKDFLTLCSNIGEEHIFIEDELHKLFSNLPAGVPKEEEYCPYRGLTEYRDNKTGRYYSNKFPTEEREARLKEISKCPICSKNMLKYRGNSATILRKTCSKECRYELLSQNNSQK